MSGSLPHAISSHSMVNNQSSGYSAFDQRADEDNNRASLNARNAKVSSDFIITLSEQGQALSHDAKHAQTTPLETEQKANESLTEKEKSDQEKQSPDEENTGEAKQLTPEEKKQIEVLKRRDQEVRTHELAHSSAGGAQTGTPTYSFKTGPDGKRYITDGEVSITVNQASDDPQMTIANMEQVYRAALAPAEPSAADRKAAAEAQAIIREAKQKLSKQQTSESLDVGTPTNNDKTEPSGSEKTSENNPITMNRFNPYKDNLTRGDFLNQIV